MNEYEQEDRLALLGVEQRIDDDFIPINQEGMGTLDIMDTIEEKNTLSEEEISEATGVDIKEVSRTIKILQEEGVTEILQKKSIYG